MDQSITAKDVSHRYIVVITDGASVTRRFINSNPDAIGDEVIDITGFSPNAKVEYKRLGQGTATFIISVGKLFHSQRQADSYACGYTSGQVTNDGLDDLSWLGANDADRELTQANERAELRRELRAER